MQRINLSWFTQLGAAMAPLKTADILSRSLQPYELHALRQYLVALGQPFSLKASAPITAQVIGHIDEILDAETDKQAEVFEAKKLDIFLSMSKLDTLLDGELAVQPVYLIFPKRAYDVDILATDGTRLLSPAVQAELTDDERYDLIEAGKCLAFEIPTAAGFHIFRAAESILLRYYQQIVGTLPKKKARNWGIYIKNLRKCNANEKVVALLDEIRELHRNPIIHPEERLTVEESLSLIGVVESAISAMHADLISLGKKLSSPSAFSGGSIS